MNLMQRKIHLYNVTFGLYMLDWWERYLFNILMIVLLWFISYNGFHAAAEFYRSCSVSALCRCFEVLSSEDEIGNWWRPGFMMAYVSTGL